MQNFIKNDKSKINRNREVYLDNAGDTANILPQISTNEGESTADKSIKCEKLAKLLAYLFAGLRSTSSGLAILFLLKGLFIFYLQVSIATSLSIAAPLALIITVSSFSLYVKGLEKRIFDLLTDGVTGNNAAIEEYHATYPGQLNILIKIRNAIVYFISILASFVEGAAIFYSTTKVLNTILLMSSVSSTTQLFPMIVAIGGILAVGATVASLGVTAVAIRELLGYKSDSKNKHVKSRKYENKRKEYPEGCVEEAYYIEIKNGYIIPPQKAENIKLAKKNKLKEDENTQVRNKDFETSNFEIKKTK